MQSELSAAQPHKLGPICEIHWRVSPTWEAEQMAQAVRKWAFFGARASRVCEGVGKAEYEFLTLHWSFGSPTLSCYLYEVGGKN